MRLLTKKEKSIYENLMRGITIDKLDCWNLTAPEDFENHTTEEFK